MISKWLHYIVSHILFVCNPMNSCRLDSRHEIFSPFHKKGRGSSTKRKADRVERDSCRFSPSIGVKLFWITKEEKKQRGEGMNHLYHHHYHYHKKRRKESRGIKGKCERVTERKGNEAKDVTCFDTLCQRFLWHFHESGRKHCDYDLYL